MSSGPISIHLLGPLRLEVRGRPVPVLSVRQREMLVVLAVSVGRAVPVDTIAAALWGDRASANPRGNVHTIASRLRKVIGDDVLVTTPQGYVLRMPEDSVDLYRFRALVKQARAEPGPDPDRELVLLRDALALWRGEPFPDVSSGWLHQSVAPGLLEEWFAVVERRFDLELAAGQYGEMLAELRVLVARYPLRETLWARLILALYRSGRQAEGFAAYRTIAASLREEYGADPGEDLDRVYRLMLHGDGKAAGAPVAPVAAPGRLGTLPRDLETFTGRDAELDTLLAAGDAGTGGPAVVCVLEGMAGVGKTTLAVHAAHALADRYPDGQLYLDLRAYTPGANALTTGAALAQLLGVFGVDRRRVPDDVAEAAALWRSALAGRRVLLVLDNVADSAQVRPLLPGAGACLVLVTSRRRLVGLDGARIVPVGLPDQEAASALFVRMSGRAGLAADAPDVAELVRLCGRLPLALAVSAARLQHHPVWTAADLVGRLRDQRRRMAELRAEDRTVAQVFALSVDQLAGRQGELLALLTMFTHDSFDVYAAAALAGVPVPAAEAALEALADVHLIEEPVAGRYRLHDLLRLYCRDRFGPDVSNERRSAATRRLLRYHVGALDSVDGLLRSSRPPSPFDVDGSPVTRVFRHTGEALAWCAIEHGNLLAAVELAAERGEHEFTWQLAWLLWSYLDRGGYRTDMLHVQGLGLAAARITGHHQAETRSLNNIGLAYQDLGRYEESLKYLHECRERAHEYGLPEQWLAALNNIAITCARNADHRSAIDYFRQVAEQTTRRSRRAEALGNLGEAYRLSGDLVAALDYGLQAWKLLADTDDIRGAAALRLQLVETYRLLDDPDHAIDHATAALAVLRPAGDQGAVAETLTHLGNALHQRGDPRAARAAWQEALDILDRIGAPEADTVRQYLAQ